MYTILIYHKYITKSAICQEFTAIRRKKMKKVPWKKNQNMGFTKMLNFIFTVSDKTH